MAKRPSWDDYFMKITQDVSTRATCVKRKVGSIIVKENRILATGYNGAPLGFKHCTEETCIRKQMKVPSGQRHEAKCHYTSGCAWSENKRGNTLRYISALCNMRKNDDKCWNKTACLFWWLS